MKRALAFIRRHWQTASVLAFAAMLIFTAGAMQVRLTDLEDGQQRIQDLQPAVTKATAERNATELTDIRNRTFIELQSITVNLAETRRDVAHIKETVDDLKKTSDDNH